MTITPEELAAIEARAEAAIPGPWRLSGGDIWADNPHDNVAAVGPYNYEEGVNVAGVEFESANAEFLVHARTDVPKLVRMCFAYINYKEDAEQCIAELTARAEAAEAEVAKLSRHVADLRELRQYDQAEIARLTKGEPR